MADRKTLQATEQTIQKQYAYIDKIKDITTEISNKEGRQPTYDIRVFGCQMNEHDAEKIAGMLDDMGYSKVTEGDKADIIVFDTCCVRENAEEKVYGHLGLLKPSDDDEKKSVVAITGCMMQQPHVVEKIKNHIAMWG